MAAVTLCLFLMIFLTITKVDSRCQMVNSLITESIADNSFTASTTFNGNFEPEKARITASESWCSQPLNGNISVSPWIQVDLGDTYEIHSIGVAGYRSGPWNNFIVNYYVLYGSNNESLQFVNDPNIGQAKVFPRYRSRLLQTRLLPVPVLGKVIRIMALPGSASTNRVCIKFDVNGCVADNITAGTPGFTPSSTLNQIRLGSTTSTTTITNSKIDFALPSSMSKENSRESNSQNDILNGVMITSTATLQIDSVTPSVRIPSVSITSNSNSSVVMAAAVSAIVAIVLTMVILIIVFGLSILVWNVIKKRRNMKRVTQTTTNYHNSNHYYEDIAGTISMRRNREIARYPQYDKLSRQNSVLEEKDSIMTRSVSESALYDHLRTKEDSLKYDYVSTERMVVTESRTSSKTSVESVSLKIYKEPMVCTPINESEQEEWIYNESYGQST